jgi:hypothetical protein
MMTTFLPRTDNPNKECSCHPDHWISFTANKKDDIVFVIRYKIAANMWAIWRYETKQLSIQKNRPYKGIYNIHGIIFDQINLPFFEPDFSQGSQKLIEKLRLYMLLS